MHAAPPVISCWPHPRRCSELREAYAPWLVPTFTTTEEAGADGGHRSATPAECHEPATLHCRGTVFRVVQDQLKVSEASCGRCNEVFNALEGPFDSPRVSWLTPSQRGASIRPRGTRRNPAWRRRMYVPDAVDSARGRHCS
jgi:hypothetical protein